MSWQLISTHDPKQDHRVLLWHEGAFKVPHIGWFNQADQKYELVESFKDKREIYIHPSHWHVLPARPKV